eukprot:6981610-Lingulodinium_polyedra.AAC.1
MGAAERLRCPPELLLEIGDGENQENPGHAGPASRPPGTARTTRRNPPARPRPNCPSCRAGPRKRRGREDPTRHRPARRP